MIGDGDPLGDVCSNPTRLQANMSGKTVGDLLNAAGVTWAWSTGMIAPDVVIRQTPVNYSFRGGLSYDSESDSRGVNLVARTGTNASDPNVLPGSTDFAAPDGPDHEINTGHIWDQAIRAGLSVRNYGFFVDNIGSAVPYPGNATTPQVRPANAALAANSDLNYRGFDMHNADYFLYQEWSHDFDTKYASGGFTALNLIRLPTITRAITARH